MLVYVVWTYKHFYQCSRWQLTPKRQKYKCVWILLLDLFLFCGIVLCSRERDSMTTLENFYFGNINPSSSRAVFVGSGQVWPLPYSCGGSSSPQKAGLFGDPVRARTPRRSWRRWRGCLMDCYLCSRQSIRKISWSRSRTVSYRWSLSLRRTPTSKASSLAWEWQQKYTQIHRSGDDTSVIPTVRVYIQALEW